MLEQNQNGSHTECWNKIKMAAILNVGTESRTAFVNKVIPTFSPPTAINEPPFKMSTLTGSKLTPCANNLVPFLKTII